MTPTNFRRLSIALAIGVSFPGALGETAIFLTAQPKVAVPVVRSIGTMSDMVNNFVVVLLTEIRAPFQERPGHSGDEILI